MAVKILELFKKSSNPTNQDSSVGLLISTNHGQLDIHLGTANQSWLNVDWLDKNKLGAKVGYTMSKAGNIS